MIMSRLYILLGVFSLLILNSCEKAETENLEYEVPEFNLLLADNVEGAPSLNNEAVSIYIGVNEKDIDFWRQPLSLSIETFGKNKVYLIGDRVDDEYILVDEIRNTEGSLSIWPWFPGFVVTEYSNMVQFALAFDQFPLINTFRSFVFRVRITALDTGDVLYSDWYTLINWHENQEDKRYYTWLIKGKKTPAQM